MDPRIIFLLLCSLITRTSTQYSNIVNCGPCPAGTERAAPPAGYACGTCVPSTQSCAAGYYKNGNTCQQCPCPGNGNGNPFGTTCSVVNGEVQCNCPANYGGRDCSTCAPGCIQEQQYPYSCIRPTNTQCYGTNCAPQILPPVVVQQPAPVVVQQPRQVYVAPQPQPCPTVNCPVVVPQPQPIVVAPQPQPCPVVNCPVVVQQPQPQPQPCPVVSCPPAPAPQPCPVVNCPPVVLPQPQPCPPCQQTQCPDCNCGPCPQTNCPSCPSPCQQCPPAPPCNNCPNPCPQCPSLTCSGNNVTCPSPCPKIPACPACNMTVVGGCEVEGSVSYCYDIRGRIEDIHGRYFCKENVEGHTCSICKQGYFGLSEFNPSGCAKCFGSGVTDYCKVAVLYRTTLQIFSSAVFHIAEMSSSEITVLEAVTSSSGAASKTFASAKRSKLLWVLPAEFLGNRITSYGGKLSCSRRYSGASPLGSDHDVIIVGARGGIIYWSSFTSPAPFKEETFTTILSEHGGWIASQDGTSRPATRADIMFVLAEIQAIYVRASFSATTSSTTIRDCKLDTVSESVTADGLILDVEQCRCPPGYKGLSCESCSHGYYRDISDTSRSVFGACKKCPCGAHASGCRYELGSVICICRSEYSGPLCQDREYLSISMDPFRIREIVDTVVQFNCSYITNSRNRFTLEITTVPSDVAARVETTSASIQSSVPLSSRLTQVICTLKDGAGMEVACAKSTIVIDIEAQGTAFGALILPPPPLVAVIASSNFICVNETDQIVGMNCSVSAYGLGRVNIEWRKETENGTDLVSEYDLRDMRKSAKLSHAGTYICSATLGNITSMERIAIVVIPISKNSSGGGSASAKMRASWRASADDPNAYNDIKNNVLTTEDPTKFPADSNVVQEKRPDGFPKIKIEPSELTVKVGEPAAFKCKAKGKAPLKFYWKSGKSSYIPHHARAAHGSLMFDEVTKDDEGDYFCIAWNELGQSSETAKLIVVGSGIEASNATLTVFPEELSARAGENVNFQCKISDSSVKTSWTRKDGQMPTSSEVKNNRVLTLYRVSAPNGGIYICSAILPNGQTIQAEGKLTIQ